MSEAHSRLRGILFHLVQWTWGLPVNLVGGLGWAYFRLRGCPGGRFRQARFIYVPTRLGGGLSIGMFLFFPDRIRTDRPEGGAGTELLAHEYGHTLQVLRLGPFYWLAIGLPSLLWYALPACERWRVKHGRPYRSLYTESWADRLGSYADQRTVRRRYRYTGREGSPLPELRRRSGGRILPRDTRICGEKDGTARMKRKYTILLVVVLLLAGMVAAGYIIKGRLEKNLKSLASLAITDPDLSRVPDGEYTGSYAAFPVSAEVRVAVANGKITGITLVKHVTGQGQPAEVLPDRVVEEQTLQVDAVAGATYSSKVILKAIERALAGAAP